MGKFLVMLLRIFITTMILTLGTYYVVYFYSDSLAFLTDFQGQRSAKAKTQNVATEMPEHKETQTIDTPEIHKPAEEVIPEVKSLSIPQKSQSYALCSQAFILFHSITIKFFENQSCHDEVIWLKSFDFPRVGKVVLDEVDALCQMKEEDLIQNSMLSKMLQIKKISTDQYRKMHFLEKMAKLQVYFYSEDFIKLCKQ